MSGRGSLFERELLLRFSHEFVTVTVHISVSFLVGDTDFAWLLPLCSRHIQAESRSDFTSKECRSYFFWVFHSRF